MRTKGSKNNAWAPRGNGKLIDDNFLIQEYIMNKKNASTIARENGWCAQTVKTRLIRLGVYQGDTRKTSTGYSKFTTMNTSMTSAQVISPVNVPTPQSVQQSVSFGELSDEEKKARREESKRRYEEMKRNGLV